jgi:peptidoglycan biosynthesis protein MviN/MurJ (putative lipid II flippase)
MSQSQTQKRTIILFGIRLLRMFVSILNLSLSAKFFGVSLQRDAWILSLGFIIVIDQALWGGINETFRTKFIFVREKEGEPKALEQTFSLLFYTSIATIFLSIIVTSFPGVFTKILAPSYKQDQVLILTNMLRVLAPSLMFTQVTLLGTSILNAYNSFYVPEIMGFFSTFLNLALIYFLAPKIGIYSLAYSYYIGIFVLLILLIFEFRKRKIQLFKYRSFNIKYVYVFLIFALPYYAPYFFGQVNSLVEKSIASYIGQGTVSMVDYSRKFIDIPLSVLGSVLSTILLPALSLSYARGKAKDYIREFNDMLQLGLLIMFSFIAFMIIGAGDVIGILYSKGISGDKLLEITHLTIFYSITSMGLFLYYMMNLSLLSMNKGKIGASLGITIQITMILLNLFLFKKIGVFIYPISLFISHFGGSLVMYRFMRFRSVETVKIAARYTFFGLVLIGLSLLIKNLFSNVLFEHKYLPNIAIKASIIFFIILILAFVFKLKEIKYIKFFNKFNG